METTSLMWLTIGLSIGGWITVIVILHAMTNRNDDSKVNGYYRDDERL